MKINNDDLVINLGHFVCAFEVLGVTLTIMNVATILLAYVVKNFIISIMV